MGKTHSPLYQAKFAGSMGMLSLEQVGIIIVITGKQMYIWG